MEKHFRPCLGSNKHLQGLACIMYIFSLTPTSAAFSHLLPVLSWHFFTAVLCLSAQG